MLNALILKQLEEKIYRKVLVVGTGALMNPIIVSQKESVPAIAHAICIEVV